MIAAGNKYAKLVYDAFQYQIAKEIGAMAVALKGQVDAIILTGGISHDKGLVANLTEQVGWIAPIEVRAGEFEMEALAAGACRVLSGEEEAKTYTGEKVFVNFDYLKA
jgi:butyrate kinase